MFEAFFTTPLQMTTPLEKTKYGSQACPFRGVPLYFILSKIQQQSLTRTVYFGGLQLSLISHPETFHEITFMKLERLKHKSIASLMLPRPPMCLN